MFDYLLTRFTEPNELFGPFDIRKLREGELVTNTEGMLPEASLVFLDELLNANSAILNSLLLVLNERVFRRGRETRRLPTLMVVGASNRLPEDDALRALFDRFLLRVRCDNVGQEQLNEVLTAGWKLDIERQQAIPAVSVDDVLQMQSLLPQVDFSQVHAAYLELVHRLRHAGISISDRRAVKLQRLQAAARPALRTICGFADRFVGLAVHLGYRRAAGSDRNHRAGRGEPAFERCRRPASPAQGNEVPNAEELARDLERLNARIDGGDLSPTNRVYLRDQLGVLSGRVPWVAESQQRLSGKEARTALGADRQAGMTEICALELPLADAANVGLLRTNSGVEVCEERDRIWLRTVNPADSLRRSCAACPAGCCSR